MNFVLGGDSAHFEGLWLLVSGSVSSSSWFNSWPFLFIPYFEVTIRLRLLSSGHVNSLTESRKRHEFYLVLLSEGPLSFPEINNFKRWIFAWIHRKKKMSLEKQNVFEDRTSVKGPETSGVRNLNNFNFTNEGWLISWRIQANIKKHSFKTTTQKK